MQGCVVRQGCSGVFVAEYHANVYTSTSSKSHYHQDNNMSILNISQLSSYELLTTISTPIWWLKKPNLLVEAKDRDICALVSKRASGILLLSFDIYKGKLARTSESDLRACNSPDLR